MSTYDANDYWEDQHRRETISGVGQSGYGERVNRALYRAWQSTALSFLKRRGVTPTTVFEAGAGRGDWFGTWRAVGATRIVAADLSATAAVRLSALADEAHHLDLAAPDSTRALGQYDLVAAMFVLLHITDDDAFGAALRNLAMAVGPGGWLLLADPILISNARRQQQTSHSVSRPIEQYAPPGLHLVAVEPATVICSNPVDAAGWRWHLYHLAWGATARIPGAAAIASRIDPWLSRRLRPGPSAKLALFRRDPAI